MTVVQELHAAIAERDAARDEIARLKAAAVAKEAPAVTVKAAAAAVVDLDSPALRMTVIMAKLTNGRELNDAESVDFYQLYSAATIKEQKAIRGRVKDWLSVAIRGMRIENEMKKQKTK
jgi:hypothetical protein